MSHCIHCSAQLHLYEIGLKFDIAAATSLINIYLPHICYITLRVRTCKHACVELYNNTTKNDFFFQKINCSVFDRSSLKTKEANDLTSHPCNNGTIPESNQVTLQSFHREIPLCVSKPLPPSSCCSSLTGSDSLIGAQLTGFLLGEQQPCGPSASWSEDEQVSCSPPTSLHLTKTCS